MDSNNQNNNEEEQALPFNGDASNFHVDIKDTTAGGHTLVLPKDQQQAQMTAQLQNQNVNTQPFGYTAGQMNQPQSQYAAPGMGVQPNPYNGQQMVNPTTIPGASMRVTSVPPVPPKQKKEKDKGMSIAILFSICAVLVLCGVGVYFLFFTSDKKMERKIKKAENALEEQDYDKAIELYEEICEEYPDDLDYNYALFSAYYSDKQYGNFLLKFNAYRGKIEKMSSEQVNENRSKIVDLYEMALDAADKEAAGLIAASASKVLADDSYVNNWKQERYADAEYYYSEGLYEDALYEYHIVSIINPDDTDAKNKLTNCMRDTLDSMISMENFDDARYLIEEYGEDVPGIDYDAYYDRISSMEELSETGHRLMRNVATTLGNGDYPSMCQLDGSEDAETVLSLVEGGSYLYAEGGMEAGYTGIATGLYLNKDGSYYFYHGEYENGVRSGQGRCFAVQVAGSDQYDLYDGEWANDMPNGLGTSIRANQVSGDEVITTSITGTYTNGYEDGSFECAIQSSEGYTVYGSWTSSMGEAPDIQDQYPDRSFGLDSDQIMYCVLESDETDYYWYRYYKQGNKLKAAVWKEQ